MSVYNNIMRIYFILIFYLRLQATSVLGLSIKIMQIVCDNDRVKIILTAGHNTNDAVFLNCNYSMYFRLKLHFKVGYRNFERESCNVMRRYILYIYIYN